MKRSSRRLQSPVAIRATAFAALATLSLAIMALFAAASAQAQVNSANVSAVYYPGGHFIRVGPRQWQERGDNGARFQFEELGPDESAMYLLDRSRNVQIALDVSARVILYSHNNEPFRQLYQITAMEAAGQQQQQQTQSETHTVAFSCNEGIPLVVRFVNSASESLAFVSHDSFPEVRLQIAPSGSGSRYVGGGYELHTKGDTAIITINGTQDICTRQ
ncbi:MAG: MliC family protein [Nitratireductor sp.]|nr:MliC family protein [Nitratireductor sp.]